MSFGEFFDKSFPYHLAIGMTSEEYWNEDPYLAVGFREAHKLRIEQRNQEMWMQGLYIYNAVETAVYNCFRGKGKRAKYIEKPIELFPKDDDQKEIEAQKERDKAVDFFNSMKANWERKHGSND